MKLLGISEIVIGLLLVAASSYIMVNAALHRGADPHGLALGVALFGAAIGALLSFAGLALLSAWRYRASGHLPFFAFFVVTWVVWGRSYG
jgi:hypothetical protein